MLLNKRLSRTLLVCGIVTAMGASQSAWAGPLITLWSYSNIDGWTDFSPDPGVTGSLNNASPTTPAPTTLYWGTGASGPSSLVLGNNTGNNGEHTGTATTNVFGNNISAEITHFNNPITGDQYLNTFTLTGNLTLTPLMPAGPVAIPGVDVNFNGFFFETPNVSTCGLASVSNCDDIFVLQNPAALVFGFNYDGRAYEAFLTDITGQLGLLSSASCTAAGAAAGCYGWETEEGGDNRLELAFNVRSASVPEPGSLALITLGLLGIGFSSRKGRKMV